MEVSQDDNPQFDHVFVLLPVDRAFGLTSTRKSLRGGHL